jgi:hypothetical protein
MKCSTATLLLCVAVATFVATEAPASDAAEAPASDAADPPPRDAEYDPAELDSTLRAMMGGVKPPMNAPIVEEDEPEPADPMAGMRQKGGFNLNGAPGSSEGLHDMGGVKARAADPESEAEGEPEEATPLNAAPVDAEPEEAAPLQADAIGLEEGHGGEPVVTDARAEMLRTMHEVSQHQQPESACDTPFGTVIGSALGVTAYSNCNDMTISMEQHTSRTRREGATITATTGMKWQCVEYARRSIFIRYGVLFGSVIGAVDIWRHASVYRHDDPEKKVHFARYRNHDDADRHPAVGSLVIYGIQKDMPFGHVAVVTEVVPVAPAPVEAVDEFAPVDHEKATEVATVRLAEQNYASKKWAAAGYAREVQLTSFDGLYFGLDDPAGYATLGWMTVEPDINPMFELLHASDPKDGGMPQEVSHPSNQA